MEKQKKKIHKTPTFVRNIRYFLKPNRIYMVFVFERSLKNAVYNR